VISIAYLLLNVIMYKLTPHASFVSPMFKISETTGKIVEFRRQNKVNEKDYLQVLIDSCGPSLRSADVKNNARYLEKDEAFEIENKLSFKVIGYIT
jgi:hypothetical protein